MLLLLISTSKCLPDVFFCVILEGISHELCCRAECMCLSLCMCELHATDDVQGFLCGFQTQRKLQRGQSLSREACGKAVGLREIHIWTHREWKHFKHEKQTRPAGSSIRGSRRHDEHRRLLCFAIDYARANQH